MLPVIGPPLFFDALKDIAQYFVRYRESSRNSFTSLRVRFGLSIESELPKKDFLKKQKILRFYD